MKFSLVTVSEEEYIGPFKGTKNVLFKIDVYSSVCVFHNKKVVKKGTLDIIASAAFSLGKYSFYFSWSW